ncbi:hypothetical protein Tco_1164949 [Tanacetum coccineum]
MYKEYLAEFWYSTKTLENSKVFFSTLTGGIYGEVGVNTFRNYIGSHYLPNSSEYVAPPSIDIVRPWFETIGYGEAVPAKGTLKKSLLPLREKVVPYTIFLSLLMMHKMKEGYGDRELTLYPTQVFSVNNWALKPNQPEEPPFTTHMLAICSVDKPVAFKAPKPSSNVERVSQGTMPRAKLGHKKHSTSSKQPSVSNKEATKEDQQATSGPTFLGVTSEARANPQLSSGMSAFNLNEPIYSASFIIHSESASGNDALAASKAEADPGNSAPSDFVPQQQDMNEGTKNTSYDYLFAGTDPHVFADQTKSVSEGLETILTQPITGKGASSVASQIKEETSSTIKLEDLAKLVSHVQPSFKDLDSPKADHVIIVDDSDKDEDDEVHATENSQKYKLELEKNKAEAALLKAQPSFPNVEQLKELLVKSLKTEFSNILSAYDFSSSLPTELKYLPSKFDELTEEVIGLKKQVHELEIELPGDLKEIPTKLEDFTKTVTSLTSQVASVQAKLKSLDALLGLLLNVTKALNKFAQVLDSASSKAGDQSVPSAGQADTRPAEGEKDTNQATIS